MAVNEPPFSDEFAQTARAEVERLTLRAAEVRARAEQWTARGEALMSQAEGLEAQVRELDELLGRAPQLRLDLQSGELHGQQLREAALRTLMREHGVRQPIHYRQWYELVTDAGIRATGKDPLATFLTQITRSPIVERIEGESGTYQLDPQGAFQAARNELREAQAYLNALRDPSAEDELKAGDRGEAQRLLSRAKRRFDAVLEARSSLLRVRLGTR